MELTTIYERIDANRQHMLDLWQELVNADCGSYNKAGVDAVGKRVAAFLEENGMTVRFHTCETRGDLLIAEYGDMTKPFVLFVGHLDTVFKDGTAAERPFTIRDGKAYGPGVLDMKGGIVIALYVMKLLKEWGYAKYPIKLILAGDEEVGHAGSDAVAVIQEERALWITALSLSARGRSMRLSTSRESVLTLETILKTDGRLYGKWPTRYWLWKR